MWQSTASRQNGSVVGERILLSFARSPPSPHCSPMIPSFVSQTRGGETGFAINQQAQLQFNLDICPNDANMATKFSPTGQSPVIIEKLTDGTIGMSYTPLESFKAVSAEKLALAMKLAKRNARHRKINTTFNPEICSSCYYKPRVKFKPTNEDHYKGHYEGELSSSAAITAPQSHLSDNILHSQKGHNMRASSQLPLFSVGPKSIITKEIAQLKAELERRLENGAKRRRDELIGIKRKRNEMQVKDERAWWEEEKESKEEREQRRKKGQFTRNSRMIYDLTQQVRGLERHFEKHNHEDSESIIVKKLAAAQRAALRTLQGFSGSGRSHDPIPPELSLLIQQLALLSSQLGGGASSELNASLLQLMGSLDERKREVKISQVKESHPEADKDIWAREKNSVTAKKHKKKKKNYGVLFSHKTRHQERPSSTHFTDHTFNSVMRQRPQQLYTSPQSYNSPCSVRTTPNQRTPQKCASCPPSTPQPPRSAIANKRMIRQQHPATHSTKLRVSHPHKRKEEDEEIFVNECPVRAASPKLHPSCLCAPPHRDIIQLLDNSRNISLAISLQAKQLESLREDISRKITEIKSELDRKQSEDSLQKTNSKESDFQSLGLSDSKLLAMLKRLKELETEEETICQHWTTITYEDPLVKKSTTYGIKHKTQNQSGLENHQRTRDKSTPNLTETGISTLSHLSPKSLSNIEKYRTNYSNYLTTTGISTQGGFSPWKMAERIADQLLDDMLEGVAREIEELCDNCVEGLYSSEFIRPP